jgi:hypothetical protein
MNYREKIDAQVSVYFSVTPAAKKFDSPSNRKLVADRVASWGYVPSQVGVMRALDELVTEGAITRTDGGSEASDRQAAADAQRRRIDGIASAPLTDADFHRFARMSEAEIEHTFWADPIFKVRYTLASQRWGFRLPVAGSQPKDTSVIDLGEWKTLDAKTYHSIPAHKVTQLYMSNRQFKAAIDKLIVEGKI